MKTYYRLIVLIAVLFAGVEADAQQRVYIPAPRVQADSLLNLKFNDDLKKELAALPDSLNKAERQYCTDLYKDRNQYLKDALSEGNFLLRSDLQKHVELLFNGIIQSNPLLSKELNVLVSDYRQPNAFSLGQKTLIVNLGLLYRVKSEAELTYVLCHELAHEHLQHVNRRIIKTAEIANDKELNKKIKNVSRQMYGIYRQLKDLIVPTLLDMTKNSRSNELEADSLGLVFYLNTPYSIKEPAAALLALDEFDFEKDTAAYDLKQVFNCSQFPFQDEWLTYNGASSLGSFEATHDAIEDSLKTHPDCLLRSEIITKLTDRIATDKSKTLLTADTAAFTQLTYSSYAELIYSYYLNEDYGRSIFLSLEMQRNYPRDLYAGLMIARSLSGLYIGLRDHSSYISLKRTADDYSENYNRLLAFLNELRISEVGSLAYNYFMKVFPDPVLTNEEILYTAILVNYAKENTTEFDSLKKNFLDAFSNGHHATAVTNLKIKLPEIRKYK